MKFFWWTSTFFWRDKHTITLHGYWQFRINTKNNVEILQNFEGLFESRNLKKNLELFNKENMKVLAGFKKEASKSFWMEVFCLRSKACSFKCNDKNTEKLRIISKSEFKAFKFHDRYNCLSGGEYQKNVIFIKFFQKIMKFNFKN